MAHYNKPATSIPEQIQLLRERGLIIQDEPQLTRDLETIGYYRLSGYWKAFEETPTDGRTRSRRFEAGATHSHILKLYVFDRKLRLLVMEAIERIEIGLRAAWTSQMSIEHGPHFYLNPTHFFEPTHVNGELSIKSWHGHYKQLDKLRTGFKRSKELFSAHYRRKYREPELPPIWIITELMSIGELSIWFSATKHARDKKKVAISLGLPSHEVASGVFHTLTHVRNICAHHGRLWDRRIAVRLPVIEKLRHEMVFAGSQNAEGAISGLRGAHLDDRIYNVLVVCLSMLRHQSPATSFRKRLINHLGTLPSALLASMGFPEDWRERDVWKASLPGGPPRSSEPVEAARPYSVA